MVIWGEPRRTEAVNHPALHLVFRGTEVDDRANIHRRRHLFTRKSPCLLTVTSATMQTYPRWAEGERHAETLTLSAASGSNPPSPRRV